ncbi:hypothetical protein V6Z11_D09G015800 [Gossypium hirsutum]
MGDWVRCSAFSLLFVSRYSIATVSNLTATAVFTLTAGKCTAHPNSPLVRNHQTSWNLHPDPTSLSCSLHSFLDRWHWSRWR